jgi:TetR/AcrR family transcriptional regulator, regulator of cefoperazone and chloramphenicol sensitivity
VEHSPYSNSHTQNRILEAAGEVFAEVGFRCATIRKICDRAGVNVAAINYHFRSKEALYSEVLKYWHEFAIKKYPPLLGVGEDAPPEEQLRAFILSLLFRMLDKGKPAWFGKVMAREMVEPTQAFDRMVKEVMRPLNKLLGSIIERIVGTPVSEETVRLCCTSIVGQCAYYYNTRYITQLFKRDMSSPKEIERIADHILRFSLRGLEHYSGGTWRREEKHS